MPKSLSNQTFIVLSIHEIHAERIFTKQKQFELRKVLPKEPFDKVFLYQTGGKGLVGAFDVSEVVKYSLEELWEHVGEDATTKERFDMYFGERESGCAIKVKNPKKFQESISQDVLKKEVPTFTAPQSYLIVRPGSKNHKILMNIYEKEGKKKSSSKKYPKRIIQNLQM